MKDKVARSQVGSLAKAVQRNLDRITGLRQRDAQLFTALVALTARVEALETWVKGHGAERLKGEEAIDEVS